MSAAQAHAEIPIDVIAGSKIGFEGLIQVDGYWFDNLFQNRDGLAGKDSEVGMRRAELVLKGKSTKFDWVLGYDARTKKYLDVNMKWKFGSNYVQVGQFKQINSLEELSSTRNNDFISKAPVTNISAVRRRLGVAFGSGGENWGYTANVFGQELTRKFGQEPGFGGRFYYAPIAGEGSVLHFGISAVKYDVSNNTQFGSAGQSVDLAKANLAEAGSILNIDRDRTYGLEALWVEGQFKVQSEFMRNRTITTRSDDPNRSVASGNNWYISGLWNISGESWGYKGGTPTTPLPKNLAAGMWQLGVRYDGASGNRDLDNGSDNESFTVGVNYYWRKNFKIMANYVAINNAKLSAVSGGNLNDDPNIFEGRVQFYW